MKHYLLKERFYDRAEDLRKHFEQNFATRKDISPQRFVWDYWYVENQYKLLRTPAYEYFPEKVYYPFHKFLVNWGRENLGCHDVSPTWLSYYIDGFSQNMHSDVPHGPWAFVFSLSPHKRKFTGGETFILKPQVLNYWNHFLEDMDHEENSFVEKIPANFNRLVVFDPRFPHGVTEVRGTQDPLQARLVIHGWFVEPRPYVVGPLTTLQTQRVLEPAIHQLSQALQDVGPIHGTMSLRLEVAKSGTVSSLRWLTNTIVGLENNAVQTKLVIKLISRICSSMKFPKAQRASSVTVPLLFK